MPRRCELVHKSRSFFSARGFGPALWPARKDNWRCVPAAFLDSERMHDLRAKVSDCIGELALREFLVGEI